MIPLEDESRRPANFPRRSKMPTHPGGDVCDPEPDNLHDTASGSQTLQRLHEVAPRDQVTLSWVLDHLQTQAFGLLLVLLSIAAAAPGICTIAAVLIAILAFQIALGRRAPSFPRWLANYPLRTRHLGVIVTHAIPVLRFLEKGVHPRWPRMLAAARPVLGIVVMMLSLQLIVIPLPLSNIVPAVLILLISLAYLEEDGVSVVLSLAAGVGLLAINGAVIWDLVGSQTWLPTH